MDYDKLARALAKEAHCRYCDFMGPSRTKCAGDVEDTAKQIAQALERADLNGQVAANLASAKSHCLFCYSLWPLGPDIGEDDYRHIKPGEVIQRRCDSQHEQQELAALRKRLEELGK